jgi:hypothetical protein
VVGLGGAELLDEQRHAVRTKGRGCLQAVAAGQGGGNDHQAPPRPQCETKPVGASDCERLGEFSTKRA